MASRVLHKASQRAFSSQAASPSFVQRLFFDAPTQSALTEEFPGVPANKNKAAAPREAQSTILSNGLRVVTRDAGAAVASVGVYVKAGSRYDSAPGTSHVLETLAFGSTQKRSTAKLHRDLDDIGASALARTGREVFSYTGTVLRDAVDPLTGAIAEAITQPLLRDYEVAEAKHSMEPLIEAREADAAFGVLQGVHGAAYGSSSAIGHSTYAGKSDLDDIDENTLRAFLGARFTANNIIVVANNVKHEVFVDTCDKYFLSIAEGIPTTNATTSAPGLHGPAKPAFIGGEAFTRTHEGGIAHVALGLQAPAATAKEAYALGVLQSLLGGSEGNAAAGALRKGPQRQSRIARSLHNDAHSFIRSIGAFAFPYSDAGIVGISGSCADHEAGRLVDVFAGFFKDAASVAATSAELERAKKLYKVNLALARESRDGARDDIALQTLVAGKYVNLADAFKAIDAVTAGDIQALAKNALASKPAISAIGSLANIPRYDVLTSMLK